MLQDIRFASRQLLKSPGFSIVALLTLALAIGANTAIFSAVDAVLLHPLPYPEPDRLMSVTESLPHYGLARLAPSFSEFLDYRRMATCFTEIAAITDGDATLTGEGQPEEVHGKRVSSALFPMLGIKPILGRLFMADEERYGNDHVAIISEGLWKRRYGGDRAIVGKNIRINQESYRVAAVIPPMDGDFKAELWMPLAFPPADVAPGSSGPHNIDVIGRLKPGITIEQARDEFRRIASRMVELYPNQDKKSLGFSIDVYPLAEAQSGNLRKPLWLLVSAVGAVMLIACANISNLLLARAMMRRKEIGIRAALGAGRSRVIRQLLTESLLLAMIAGLAGLLFALYGLHLYAQFGPRDLIRGPQPAINGWAMAFSLLLSMATSVIFGLAPAIEASHVDLNDALKESSRGSTAGRRLLREFLIVVEVAASIVLLIGAGLLVSSFVRLQRTRTGFRPENVLTAIIPLPVKDYPLPWQRIAFERALLERVRALPGVRSAGASDFPPFSGGAGSHIEIIGHPHNVNEPTRVVYQTSASAGYLGTCGIPLLRGRGINSSDGPDAPPVCDIDETVARKFFTNLDPVGMRVRLPIPNITCTVAGVVGATKSRSLADPPVPRIYYSSKIAVPQISLVIKAARDPLALVAAVRHEVTALDSNLPLTSVMTMDEVLADSLARQRFSIQLMAVFAAIAALLAAIGIYGVLAYVIDQRRREFGIRTALGARPADVVALVVLQGSLPVGVGLVCGVSGAFAMTWYLKSLLYEVGTTDPLVFSTISGGMVLVAILAMTVPAYRATRVDPLQTLREE
ncbi:MAG TPA: ABC transporter permease [Bryobacteraceae bacterium]|jgi:putative ABC transport system permease protein|nr:ABC transporter permease [Bryobacteraceae bacterium]